MTDIKFYKVDELPDSPEADALYWVKVEGYDDIVRPYITDTEGNLKFTGSEVSVEGHEEDYDHDNLPSSTEKTRIGNIPADTNAELAGKQDILTEGEFVNGDKTKLDGIESGATADQTDAEIKTAYENNADTNAFTDSEETKLGDLPAVTTDPSTRTLTPTGTTALDWSYAQPVMEITMDQADAFQPGTNWPATNSTHENILAIDRTAANLYTPDLSAFDRVVGDMYPSDAQYFEIVFEVIRGEKVATWLPGRNS